MKLNQKRHTRMLLQYLLWHWYCKVYGSWELDSRRHGLKKHLGAKKKKTSSKWLNWRRDNKEGPSLYILAHQCGSQIYYVVHLINVVHEHREKSWSWNNIQVEMVNTQHKWDFNFREKGRIWDMGWREIQENHPASVKMTGWTLRMWNPEKQPKLQWFL